MGANPPQVPRVLSEQMHGTTKRVRVSIVDDMVFLAQTMAFLCQHRWGFDVVSVSHSGASATNDLISAKPDVVLLDFELPDISGVALGAIVNAQLPLSRIVIVSGSWNDYQVHSVGKIKIHGFVDKFEDGDAPLRHSIELAAIGGSYFSPRYLRAVQRLRRSNTAFFKYLSNREQEVLHLVAEAMHDDEIAVQIGVSEWTVKTHRREIMRKLRIHSTPKLVRYAIELGLGRPRPCAAGNTTIPRDAIYSRCK